MNIFEREQNSFLPTYKRFKLDVERAEGNYLFTKNGDKYLDFFAGLAVNALGYGDSKITEAVVQQLSRYSHLSNFYYQEPQIQLAEQLLEVTGYQRVFFTNSGTEAIEASIKLIRRWSKKNNKSILVALNGSFHGRSMGALSLTGRTKYREGFEPFLPDVVHVDINNIEKLKDTIDDDTAAFFFEPIQGEGGVIPVNANYVEVLINLKEKYGFQIVADEIQTAMGRTGRFLACEHLGIKPDITVVAKALGGGLPLGAMLTVEDFAEYFPPGSHGTTFGGNSVSCAAGRVVVETVSEKQFLAIVYEKGELLKRGLNDLKNRFPKIIKDVRGLGLMAGVELFEGGADFVNEFLENKILINCTNETVLRLLPPLTIKKNEIEIFLEVFEKILEKRSNN